MESAIVAAITTLLTVVQTVLPTISGATASPVIISVVTALEIALFPSATSLFQSIKNIIASLSSNPDTPAQQLATLQQLDAQVDTAFEAIAAKTDPDLPSGDPLAKKS